MNSSLPFSGSHPDREDTSGGTDIPVPGGARLDAIQLRAAQSTPNFSDPLASVEVPQRERTILVAADRFPKPKSLR